jgi:hypothetical protein
MTRKGYFMKSSRNRLKPWIAVSCLFLLSLFPTHAAWSLSGAGRSLSGAERSLSKTGRSLSGAEAFPEQNWTVAERSRSALGISGRKAYQCGQPAALFR